MAWKVILGAVTAAGVALSVVAPVQAEVTGGEGWRGASYVPQGSCKYSNNTLRGWLTTSVPPPSVTGANTRRRKRNERTRVRYAVWLVDAYTGATYAVSNWSASLLVRERSWRGWSSGTSFDADWRNNYRLELRIEWWRSGRRIGWRSHRVTAYKFYDHYNTGPYGPIAWCTRYAGVGYDPQL
jgi:hypothetical protein